MKVLVTGATGFIGSMLVERLNQRGVIPRVLMRPTSSVRNIEGLKFERVSGDLSKDSAQMNGSNELSNGLDDALEGVQVVYHLAGVVSAPSEEAFRRSNVEGARRIAEAAARKGVERLVYVSSLAAGGPMKEKELRTELMQDTPSSQYGVSKRLGEEALLKYKDKFRLSILRPPMVYGPRDRGVFLFFQSVARGFVPLIRGQNSERKKYYSLIHVEDLCDAIILAAQAETPSGEIFYVAGDGVVSFEELIGEISKAYEKKPLLFPVPRWAVRSAATVCDFRTKMFGGSVPLTRDKLNEIFPDYWLCSNRKARDLLGFHPQVEHSRGLRETAQWYQKAGWVSVGEGSP